MSANEKPAYRLRERGSWRWSDGDSWVDYPSVQEAVDSLYRHGGGHVRGWLAADENAPCKRQGGAARVEDCGCQDCLDLLTELQEASDA